MYTALSKLKTPFAKSDKEADIPRVQHVPGGLLGRWMMGSLSVVVAILAVVILCVSLGVSTYYYSNLRENLTKRASATASVFRIYLSETEEQFLSNAERSIAEFEDKNKMEMQFLRPTGQIFLSSSGLMTASTPGTPDAQDALAKGHLWVYTGEDSTTGERVMSVTAPLITRNHTLVGAVRYITSLSVAERQITVMILASIVLSVLFLILVVASNSHFIKSIIQQMKTINQTAREIAQGRYGMQVAKVYDDEMGDLSDSINYMSEEIARAEKTKNEFISSVSHELRTPLTAIGGWSETLLAGGASDAEETLQGLEIIQKEARRLTQMVEELLDFSRMESGQMKLNVETFDLGRELYEAMYMYENLLQSERISLHYQSDTQAHIVDGDRHRLRQVFLNILDNAAKYGKSGGRIDVSLATQEGKVCITVRDYGDGIDENELPFVKEKFYKGSSKQRGSGIGLAVSDEIIRLHGGTLTIMSQLGAGTSVEIALPAKEDIGKE